VKFQLSEDSEGSVSPNFIAVQAEAGQGPSMAKSTNPFRYFDSSPEVIRLVVMMNAGVVSPRDQMRAPPHR
jgi:hypothetical protein